MAAATLFIGGIKKTRMMWLDVHWTWLQMGEIHNKRIHKQVKTLLQHVCRDDCIVYIHCDAKKWMDVGHDWACFSFLLMFVSRYDFIVRHTDTHIHD